MRQNSHVKNMQRTPHLHTLGSVINGRDACKYCPYRAKRGNRIPNREINYSALTVLQLVELATTRGIATRKSMRKPELVSLLSKATPNSYAY